MNIFIKILNKFSNLFENKIFFCLNLYKYIFYKKKIYTMIVENNKYQIMKYNDIKYIKNKFFFKGYIYSIIDLNKPYDIVLMKKNLNIYKIEKIILKCQTLHLNSFEITLENSFCLKSGLILFNNILSHCSIDCNIYLILYFYLKYYLEMNVKIESVKILYLDDINYNLIERIIKPDYIINDII